MHVCVCVCVASADARALKHIYKREYTITDESSSLAQLSLDGRCGVPSPVPPLRHKKYPPKTGAVVGLFTLHTGISAVNSAAITQGSLRLPVFFIISALFLLLLSRTCVFVFEKKGGAEGHIKSSI
jgi:hypothetical protein